MAFKIKDFNILSFDGALPVNYDPTQVELTSINAVLNNVYEINPLTLLASKLSGFLPEYWNAYNTFQWISSTLPTNVVFHIQNHYRAVALTILKKGNRTLDNLDRIVSIIFGKPFAVTEGVVSIDDVSDVNNHIINQYAFLTSVPSATIPSIIYKVPKTYTLTITTGTYVNYFDSLLKNYIVTYEHFRDSDNWHSTYDPSNVVSLNVSSGTNTDYQLNIKRVYAIENIHSTDFTYSANLVFKILNQVIEKDIITLVKEI